jgi:hypothetical protein
VQPVNYLIQSDGRMAVDPVNGNVSIGTPAASVQPAIYPEEAREMGLEEVPYYTHPPSADVQELVKALKLALDSHGVYLMSDPPQDAWKAYGVERIAREALAKWEGK